MVEDGSSIPIVRNPDVYVKGIDSATARVHGNKATNHFGEFSLTGFEPGEILLIVYSAGYGCTRRNFRTPCRSRTRPSPCARARSGRQSPSATNLELVRGLVVTDTIPNAEQEINLWIPLNHEGVGALPSELAGSKLVIQGHPGKPIIIEEWDGQPLDLQL